MPAACLKEMKEGKAIKENIETSKVVIEPMGIS